MHWGTAGTRLLTGTACLRVIAIGAQIRYGEIARAAAAGGHAATPLQQAIGRLVVVLLGASVALCITLAAVRMRQGHGWIGALVSAATCPHRSTFPAPHVTSKQFLCLDLCVHGSSFEVKYSSISSPAASICPVERQPSRR
ncbi:hypothetical protein [Ramlibacter rhizophilus]|uniref:P-type ATPase n=1 Tax=Ramlibacter rhizophilus TaxID=1781167 RepID=UPI001F0DF7D0|nr:hypothetical protein [Ramlibacter rhizophilus]